MFGNKKEKGERQKLSKKEKIFIAVCSAAGAGAITLGAFLGAQNAGGEDYMADGSSGVQYVMTSDIMKSVNITGTIAAVQTANLSSSITDTKIISLNVSVGDRVKKGDVICVLDTKGVERQLADAETALSAAEQKNDIDMDAAARNYGFSVDNVRADGAKKSEDVAKAQKELTAAMNDTTIASHEVDAAQNALIEAQTVYDNALVRYNSVKASNDAVKAEARKREQAVENVNTEISRLDASITEAEGQLAEATEKGDDAQAEKIQKRIDSMKKSRSGKSVELVAVTKAQSDYKYTIEDSEKALTEAETAKTNAKSDLDTKKSDLELKKTTLTEKTKSEETAKEAVITAQEVAGDTAREGRKTIADSNDTYRTSQIASITATQEQEETVEKLKMQLEESTITAPFDGVITSIGVSQGGSYGGGIIATIRDDSSFVVNANVTQFDIASIDLDMKAEITSDVTDDIVMNGSVVFVSPVPDSMLKTATAQPASNSSNSGTSDTASSAEDDFSTPAEGGSNSTINYPIKVVINDPDSRLRIGMNVNMNIISEKAEGVLTVPTACIQDMGDGTYCVQLPDTKDEAGNDIPGEMVPVKKGISDDYSTEISGENVYEGMEVVDPTMAMSGEDEYIGSDDMGGGVMDLIY